MEYSYPRKGTLFPPTNKPDDNQKETDNIGDGQQSNDVSQDQVQGQGLQPVESRSSFGEDVVNNEQSGFIECENPQCSSWDNVSTETLLQNLPSRRLACAIENLTQRLTWKKVGNKRRPGFATLRLKQGINIDTDEIARELADQEDVVDGGLIVPLTDEIRGFTMLLTTKKEISAKVKRRISMKETSPSWAKRTHYKISMMWKHFKDALVGFGSFFDMWASHLKTIEGMFGTGVTSYFRFIRGLFFLNVPVFLLTFAFVVIPQIIYRWHQQTPRGYHQNVSFTGQELLTGTDWFQETELYFGYYTPHVINVTGLPYDMKYAYICNCAGYYLLVLIILARILSNSYKNSYVQTSESFTVSYASKVFCFWDFTITSHPTAKLKHKSIFTELQELLSDENESTSRTPSQWACLIIIRLLINVAVLGMLVGSSYLMWYLTSTNSLKNDLGMLTQLAMPLCISVLNFILPFIFSVLTDLERYENPRVKLYLTMTRTVVLNVATIGVLVYSWFEIGRCENASCGSTCWETFMGTQLYCLVIIDFLFILVVTFLVEFLRSIISQFCVRKLGKPEFDIGRNTLNIVYSQILVWLGTYYSPLLSFIMIIKLFIIFYVKRVSVVHNCIPPAKAWRAGQTSTFIYAVVFLSFLLSLAAVIYGIVAMVPSSTCGPYQNYNHTYEVFTSLVDDWTKFSGSDVIRFLLDLITSAAFLAFVAIFLMVAAYYCRVVALGHYDIAQMLRGQILLEAEDKMFLIDLITEADKSRRNRGTTEMNRNKTAAGTNDQAIKNGEHLPKPSSSAAAAAVGYCETPNALFTAYPPSPRAERSNSTHSAC